MFNVSDIISGFGEELSLRQNPYLFTDSQVKVESLAQDILDRSVESPVILSALEDLGKEFSGAEDIFLDAFFHIKASQAQELMHTVNTMFLAHAVCRWLKLSAQDTLGSLKLSLFMDIASLKKDAPPLDPSEIFSRHFPEETQAALFIRNRNCYKPQEFCAATDPLRRVFGIVNLCDFFEAQIHARPDKGALRPREAINNAIRGFLAADKGVLIDFVRFIGFYPLTTAVSLSTNEKAVVVAQNKGYPLRPKVKALNQSPSEKEKIIDLLLDKDIYITGSLL